MKTSEKINNGFNYNRLINFYDSLKVDTKIIGQEQLDLSNGRNTNLFPYKGQFSPDLIKALLLRFANPKFHILDPFVGCGTSIFEAAKQNISAYGLEINPAGVEMAKTSIFLPLDKSERNKIISKTFKLVESMQERDYLKELKQNIISCKDLYVRNVLMNGIIRLFRFTKLANKIEYLRSILEHGNLILSLPISKAKTEVFHSDARIIPLPNNSIDLVITSPPYINVFNYHEHDRLAIEFLGWDRLRIAKSEFGANRKFRQNRFLTVIQYILDMCETFLEIKRVIKRHGRLIIVIGKTSKVRKIDFRNDYIISAIGYLSGYKLIMRQERKFKNQYGELIFEEILHFYPTSSSESNIQQKCYGFGQYILANAKKLSKESDIDNDLDSAIKRSVEIKASEKFISDKRGVKYANTTL